jgi:hypothetical protein
VADIPDVRHLVPGIFRLVTTPAPTLSASGGLVDLIGLLLTLLALVIAWKLAAPRPAMPIPTLPLSACDLQRESCRLTLADATRVDLSIPGRPVVPNQPFVVEGSVAGGDVRLLEVEVRGIEVEIGSPPTAFASADDGAYRTRLDLPLCATSRMTWQMTVLLMIDGRYRKWPLRFHTETVGLHDPPNGASQ